MSLDAQEKHHESWFLEVPLVRQSDGELKNLSPTKRPEMKHQDETYGLTLSLVNLVLTLPRYYSNTLNYMGTSRTWQQDT